MHEYLLLGDRSRAAQDYASAAYWYQKIVNDRRSNLDEKDVAHYLCAYTLVSEKQSEMVGLGPDLRLRYCDDEQAGIHIKSISDPDFDPASLGLPVLSSSDLVAISLAHGDAGLAILMNSALLRCLSSAQIISIGKSELRAMFLIYRSPNILERLNEGALQDITSAHRYANLVIPGQYRQNQQTAVEPQLAMA